MKLVYLTTIITGALFVLMAIPLILNKIKPNNSYGFRTKKTLSNDIIWYKANKFAGWCLLCSGIIMIIGSISLNKTNTSLENLSIFLLLSLIMFPLIISVILSFIYLKKL